MSGAQINTNKRRTSAVAVAIITTIIATIVPTPVVVTIVASRRRYVFFENSLCEHKKDAKSKRTTSIVVATRRCNQTGNELSARMTTKTTKT